MSKTDEKKLEEEKKISRRNYLKYAGAGVVAVAVAGAGAYYATRPGPTPTPTTTVTSTVASTGTPTLVREPPPSQDPLIFDIWAFRPEIPESIAEICNKQFDENVKVEVLSGNFFALIEGKFMANAPIDMCYTGASTAHRYYAAKWAIGLNDIEKNDIVPYDIKEILADLNKGKYQFVDGYTAQDGQLLGLPYFQSSRCAILANDLVLAKAGLDGPENYPETYDEMYANIEKLAKAGVKEPYWIHWWVYPSLGPAWEWISEIVNTEGEEALFDSKTFEPNFDINTKAAEVLKTWKWLWDNNYVNHGIISMNSEGDYLAGFASGRYAYSGQQTYDLKTFNDPSFSKIAGHVSPVPPKKHGWGILDACGYTLMRREWAPYKEQRAKRMVEVFGYKDKNGEYAASKKWLMDAPAALQSGYEEANLDPEVISSWKKWVAREEDIKVLDDLLKTTGCPPVWKTYWYFEWQTRVNEWLPLFLQGKKTLNETIEGLREYALELKKTYTF